MGELYEPFPKLPKNFRQIGERDQVLKLYLEDYVNTYLKRLQPAKGADLRVGLLLGSRETHEDIPFVFVDGALEMDSVTEEGGKVAFTEDAWKKAYQDVEQMFPKRTVQGWFLCAGPGCTLSPLTYWKQHSQYFTGKNQLMYLNCGLEGEEAVYITSSDGFYKLRGYSIYYERNQMMQDYMILRKDVPRAETGVMIRSSRILSKNGRAQGGGRTSPEHGGSFVRPLQCTGCHSTGRRRGYVQQLSENAPDGKRDCICGTGRKHKGRSDGVCRKGRYRKSFRKGLVRCGPA